MLSARASLGSRWFRRPAAEVEPLQFSVRCPALFEHLHLLGRSNAESRQRQDHGTDGHNGLGGFGYNPFDPRRSIALCNFDLTHSFVLSYDWVLPFEKMVGPGWMKTLAGGWTLSGITRFATGLPVSLSEGDDASLIGANAAGLDVPNFAGGGQVLADTNPRHRQKTYFNVALFTTEQLGQLGNSRRRFFHGPGLNNWDITLAKVTRITESKQLELRVEAFNLFNHAQFNNPDGGIDSGPPDFVNGEKGMEIYKENFLKEQKFLNEQANKEILIVI